MIDFHTANRLKSMVGFRNISIYDYQSLNMDIMKEIVEKHLDDFMSYTKQILEA